MVALFMITELIDFLRDTSASFKERLNLPTNSHSRAKLIFSGGLTFLVFFFHFYRALLCFLHTPFFPCMLMAVISFFGLFF